MAPRWRWLLVTLAAVAVSCLVPGSMLSRPPPTSAGAAIVTAPEPAPSGSECAAIACNRGPASSTVPLAGMALAGIVATAALVVLAPCTVRRTRREPDTLPSGSRSPLLRPPQHLIAA